MMTMRLKRIFSVFCAIVVLVACAFTSVELFCENSLNIKTYSSTIRTISSEERVNSYNYQGWDFVALSNDECEYRLYYDLQDDGIHIMGICLDGIEDLLRERDEGADDSVYIDENGNEFVSHATPMTIKEVSGIIEIPATINGIDVVSIDQYLGYWDDVTEFIIPNTVTYIGSYAFSNNPNLTTITIPDSVTYIGSYAFSNNPNLTTITIPDSVTYIGSYAFSNTNLTTITIPDGITYIESFTFSDNKNLTTITIPDGVTYIDKGAFSNNRNLTTITIPNSVTYMASNTLSGDTNLREIYYDGTWEEWNLLGVDLPDSTILLYFYVPETDMTETSVINTTAEITYGPETTMTTPTYETETTTTTETYTTEMAMDGEGWEPSTWVVVTETTTTTETTTETTSGIVIEAPDENELYVGNQFQLSVQGDYTGALFWASSDASVATVDSSGVVTITGNGTVTILVIDENMVTYPVTFTIDSTSTTTQTTETTTNTKSGIVIEAPDESELYVGNQFQLSIQGDYTERLFWGSTDTSVATVDSLGVVTITSNGTVTILVMNENAVIYDSITFTIGSTTTETTSGIVIEAPDESELYVGNQFQLSVQGDYTGALFWASSDKSVATVDSRGVVTITGNGNATILVMDDNMVIYPVTFTVDSTSTTTQTTETTTETYDVSKDTTTTTETTSGIVIEAPDENELYVGNQFQLSVQGNYTGALFWASSDASVATVDSSGVVTITGNGTVTLLVMDENAVTYSITFTVDSTSITTQTTETTTETTSGIVIEAPDESELYVGNQFQLSVQGDYTGALFWASSDASVATVDSSGVVTITGNGTATILVMDENAVTYSITFTIDSAMELGDIDGDNQITPTDAYICLVVYANIQLGLNTGMSSEQLAAADVNGDGTVDTMDSYYTLCYYAEVQLHGVATWSEILSR